MVGSGRAQRAPSNLPADSGALPVEYTAWIESTALSIWLRESISLLAFPTALIIHAIGMGFLAGTNAVVDLRILGFARKTPLSSLERFFPVMWFGLIINVISGILLFIAYPTKAATNPVFYLKLGCIAAGVFMTLRIRARVLRAPSIDLAASPSGKPPFHRALDVDRRGGPL